MVETSEKGHLVTRESASDRLAAHLLEQIDRGAFEEDGKLPSRSALARRFEVSLPTVTAAIRSLSDRRLVEFVPGKGIFVASEHRSATRSFTVGLIGWFASHYAAEAPLFEGYWRGIFRSLVTAANRRDCAVSTIPGTDAEPLDIPRVVSHRPDCLISHGIELRAETVRELRRRGMPLVMGNRYLESEGVSYVDYDVAGGFREVVRILHERGHRRIACLLPSVVSQKSLDI